MIVTTITCADNLHEAKVMAESVKRHMPDVRVVLCLVEREMHPAAQFPAIDEVILAKDIGLYRFHSCLFKYGLLEAVTSLKPQLMACLLERYPEENEFLFMDADIKVYQPFNDLRAALTAYPILITPQQTEAGNTWHAHLRFGIYNTGLFAVARSEETNRFLQWWGDRLYGFCFREQPLFVDQKWIDLAPAMFHVHIFRHPGYNVAGWNLMEPTRVIAGSEQDGYWMTEHPLYCFHFSGLSSGFLDNSMWSVQSDPQGAVHQLVTRYREEIDCMGRAELENEPWSYDYYESGERIEDSVRKLYGDSAELTAALENPFSASNEWIVRCKEELAL